MSRALLAATLAAAILTTTSWYLLLRPAARDCQVSEEPTLCKLEPEVLTDPKQPPAPAPVTTVEPCVPDDGSLQGTVWDRRHTPIPDAHIWLLVPQRGRAWSVLPPEESDEPLFFEAECRTDDQGRFRMPDVPAGMARLVVETAGRPLHALWREVRKSEPIDIVLSEAASVSGSVRIEGGEALPDARIEAMVNGGTFTSVSDTKGHYELQLPPGEIWYLKAFPPGRRPRRSLCAPRLRAGEGWTYDFEFPRGGSVEGLVLQPDGRPAVGAAVVLQLFGGEHDDEVPTTTDDRGTFCCDGLVPGAYVVHAVSEDGVTLSPCVLGRRANDESIRSGGLILIHSHRTQEQVAVHLSPFATVRGLVLDDDRQPVAGALVQVEVGESVPLRAVETDAEGRFFSQLQPGAYASVAAYPPGIPPRDPAHETRTFVVRPGQSYESVVLHIGSCVPVELHVTDEEGQGIAAAIVSRAPPEYRISNSRSRSYGDLEQTRTGPDGSLFSKAWTCLLYRLRVSAPGYQAAIVDLDPDSLEEIREHVVLRRLPDRSIEGEVVTPNGKPICGATVAVPLEPAQVRWDVARGSELDEAINEARDPTALSDISGKFRLHGVPDGPASLAVYAEGFRARLVDPVQSGETRRRLVLHPKRSRELEGRVVLPSGAPAARVCVELRQARTLTGPDGDFRLRIPKDAKGSIRVRGPEIHRAEFALGRRTQTPLRLVVEPRPRLEGRVLGCRGQPVGYAWLRAEFDSGHEGDGPVKFSIRTAPDGAYSVLWPGERPPPPRATLRVHLPDFVSGDCAPILLPEFSWKEEVTLLFPSGVPLRARVVGPSGQPLADLVVYCKAWGSTSLSKTDPDGTVQFRCLPDEPITMRLFDKLKHCEVARVVLDPAIPENIVVLEWQRGEPCPEMPRSAGGDAPPPPPPPGL